MNNNNSIGADFNTGSKRENFIYGTYRASTIWPRFYDCWKIW